MGGRGRGGGVGRWGGAQMSCEKGDETWTRHRQDIDKTLIFPTEAKSAE